MLIDKILSIKERGRLLISEKTKFDKDSYYKKFEELFTEFCEISQEDIDLQYYLKTLLEEYQTTNEELKERNEQFQHINEKLSESEERLSLALDAVNDGLWDFDGITGNVFWSSRIYTMLGYEPFEIEPSFNNWLEFLHPDDKPKANEAFKNCNDNKTDFYNEEFRLRTKDNNWKWILARGKVISRLPDGEIKRIVGTHSDITERKKIELELIKASQVFDNILTGLYVYKLENIDDDHSLRMVFANPASETLTGAPVKEITGKLIDEIFPNLRKFNVPEKFVNVVRTQKPYFEDELFYSDQRVLLNAFAYKVFPLPNNQVCISFENITEMKNAINEIIKAKEHAEESDRLKTAFLANMSHEIRTPMNGIIGFTGLLKETSNLQDEQKKYIDVIYKSSNQLLRLINDILDISKIEVGQLKIVEQSTNLNRLFDELFSFFNKSEKLKQGINIFIYKDLGDDNCMITTDELRLRQILINLIDNSIKFTSNGYINFGYKLINNNTLEFYVKDTGIGISPEKQLIIFDRFRQAEENISIQYGGSGLGLAIAKGLVELLGGKIWLYSKIGEGSEFRFSLPLKTIDIKILKPTISPKNYYEWSDKTILIVEDDEFSLTFLETALAKTNAKLILAKTGLQSIEYCVENNDISIVLMDIRLPDISGYEATRAIKSIRKNLPIIAQTANALTEDRINSIDAGCSGFISKPIDKDELLQIISKYI